MAGGAEGRQVVACDVGIRGVYFSPVVPLHSIRLTAKLTLTMRTFKRMFASQEIASSIRTHSITLPHKNRGVAVFGWVRQGTDS